MMLRLFGRLFHPACTSDCGHDRGGGAAASQPVTAIVRRNPIGSERVLSIRSAKPKLIAVDADPHVLNFIARVAEPWYHVIAARDSCWAKAWLLQYHDVGAVVATESLSCGEGAELLERCAVVRPDVLRVLVTPDTTSRRSVGAATRGVAQRLVEWPLDEGALRMAIDPSRLGIEVTPHALVA